ncbi:MAG: glycosyltransferase family 4 protein [Thermoleophilaceae bacterium]
MARPRILVLHNRYRIKGGEERSVELQLRALARAGVEHRLLERRSRDTGRGRAAGAMLIAGERPDEVGRAVRELGADVVHVHNMQPLFGPRSLEAAREAGARVVMHLHNARLFCAIGVAARDGGPCFRCRGRLTLPGLVLNCRQSLPEAAVYAAALSLQQPRVFGAVDRFLAPSGYAVGQLAKLGVPAERLEPLPHYLPDGAFAERSRADAGRYALVAARLAPEKGIDTAIEAAAAAQVPLKVAGEGPAEPELRELARRLRAPVEFLGRVGAREVAPLLAGAGALVLSSRYHEFSPYAVLEAMAVGVPVAATRMGGMPELVGADTLVPVNDAPALADRLGLLWEDADRRREEGEAVLERARARHSEARFTEGLASVYERVLSG